MDRAELIRWRRRVGIPAPGRYSSQQHPKAPRRPVYFTANKTCQPIRAKPGSYRRKQFTESEIEALWFALCKVVDYVGGSYKLFTELTGLSKYRMHKYVKAGRLTADAAHIIGLTDDMPFSREELRPDIDIEGWKDFDLYVKNNQDRWNRKKYKDAHRID